jgi:sugar transferase (PEP-CTERM/EpsH1 system associated)
LEMARQQDLEDKLLVAGRSDSGLQLLLFPLIRIMRAYRPHIVHSRNWGAIEAIPAACLAGVPIVIHSEHGYEVETITGLPSHRRLLRRAAYAMADAVFTVSVELRAYHAKQAWVSQKHIRVIHNGVDTARFSPRPEIQQEVRRRFGLSAHAFVVGAVGRMVSIKDYQTLLRAAELLAGKGVDLQVVFVGSGPELSGLQQTAEASAHLSGHVRFLGTVPDTAEILNAMDAFVLPSLSEGMSNTLLEAMASGLAVVATNVGGNPELVVDGSSGYLFPPGDSQALASVLEELSRDPERRCQAGQAARRRALDEFSLDGMISNYRNLYLELGARRRVPVPKGA